MNHRIAVVCLWLAAAAAAAAPAERDAVAMAERGAALIKAKGQEETIKRIQAGDPSFVQASLALAVRDLYTGVILADPRQPELIGTEGTSGRHAAPRPYPRQVIALAQKSGKGWLAAGAGSADGAPLGAYLLRVDDVVLEARLYPN